MDDRETAPREALAEALVPFARAVLPVTPAWRLTTADAILAALAARGYVLSRASEPLDVERLRDAVQACLVELSESPLPGARYAYEVVRRRFRAALSTTSPEAPEPDA